MCLGLLLVGYSVPAVKFMRYALPLFAAIDLLAAIGVVAGIGWLLRKRWLSPIDASHRCGDGAHRLHRRAVPRAAGRRTVPSLFRNGIGERLAPAGATFPEEAYDYGIREAVSAIAAVAAPWRRHRQRRAGVVAYYLEASGRPDLRVRSLSAEGLPRHQRRVRHRAAEHLTFENRDTVTHLQRESPAHGAHSAPTTR